MGIFAPVPPIADPSRPLTPRHSAECLCLLCEQSGSGYFAQRAALAGDVSAAAHLGEPVFALLSARRAKTRRTSRGAR